MSPEIKQNKTNVRKRNKYIYYEFLFDGNTNEDSVNVGRCSEFSTS
jgi:hypothetical protein